MRYIEITEPGDPSVLRISERPAPGYGKEEVLIKVNAAGVNRPDVIQRLGFYPPPPGASDIPGQTIRKNEDHRPFSLLDEEDMSGDLSSLLDS